MPLYKMTVAYDGTRFAGFQRQTSNVDSTAGRRQADVRRVPKRPHWDGASGKRKRIAATIQECIEDALIRYVQDEMQLTTTLEEMCLKLAGRTDRGVHARGQVIAVRLPLPSAFLLASSVSSSRHNNDDDDDDNNNSSNNMMMKDPSSLSSLKDDNRNTSEKDSSNNNGNSAATAATAATTTEIIGTTNNSPNYSETYFIRMEEIRKGINSRLPVDICVVQVQELDASQESFEPRHDVQRKVYSYTIKYRRKVVINDNGDNNSDNNSNNCRQRNSKNLAKALARLGPDLVRDPFDSNCLWVVPWALDDSCLQDLCQNLQGRHNFRAFVHKKDRNERDHILTVDRMQVKFLSVTTAAAAAATTTTYSSMKDVGSNNNTITTVPDDNDAPIVVARFEFEAKGFRRSMIRNLVGFCVDICRGYEPAVQLSWEDIWSSSSSSGRVVVVGEDDDRAANAIHAAAASGLCLERVIY